MLEIRLQHYGYILLTFLKKKTSNFINKRFTTDMESLYLFQSLAEKKNVRNIKAETKGVGKTPKICPPVDFGIEVLIFIFKVSIEVCWKLEV